MRPQPELNGFVMNKSKLNVAVIGLGTVGSGVIKLLRKQKNNIKKRTGIELKVVAVSAKNRRKQRSVDISPFRWIASPVTIVKAVSYTHLTLPTTPYV